MVTPQIIEELKLKFPIGSKIISLTDRTDVIVLHAHPIKNNTQIWYIGKRYSLLVYDESGAYKDKEVKIIQSLSLTYDTYKLW